MVVGELAHDRDIIIIGGGPGGYNSAIRAAQLGRKVTIIEKEQIGGVCLNKGCIPSKVFTETASKLASFKASNQQGIISNQVTFELQKLQDYKNKVVSQLRNGVEALCKANKVEIIRGTAYFTSENRIGVECGDQYEVYQFKKAIIATGSRPVIPKGITVDCKRIYDSLSICSINEVPDSLIVYGFDYLAIEMAFCFHNLGAKVTIVMETEDFHFDSTVNRELKRLLKKEKIKLLKHTQIIDAETCTENVIVTLKNNETIEALTASHLYISFKMTPNTSELGIERLGIETTEDHFIQINEVGQTSFAHIYAIGDVTEGPNLAIKAIKQGKVAAESIAGIKSEIDLRFLPTIIRSTPPIAVVGLSEEEANKQGYETKSSQFSFSANGFATLIGKKDGFVKVVFDRSSDHLLGVHIVGEGAVELISSGTLSLELVAREEDLTFPLYPHPSLNEGLLEAVEALSGRAIHIPPSKQDEKIVVR